MPKAWKVLWIVQLLSLYKVRGWCGGSAWSQKVDEEAVGVQGCSRLCGIQEGTPGGLCWDQTL